MLRGGEAVVVDVDAGVALMDVEHCVQDGYLVRRDICFYWMYRHGTLKMRKGLECVICTLQTSRSSSIYPTSCFVH